MVRHITAILLARRDLQKRCLNRKKHLNQLNYLNHIFIEHVVDVGISLFLLPPVVHMVIPGSPRHLSKTHTHHQWSVEIDALLFQGTALSLLCFVHTVSLHELVDVAVPVSRFWLGQVHASKVIVRDGIVFGIASHIDHLQKKKKNLAYKVTLKLIEVLEIPPTL